MFNYHLVNIPGLLEDIVDNKIIEPKFKKKKVIKSQQSAVKIKPKVSTMHSGFKWSCCYSYDYFLPPPPPLEYFAVRSVGFRIY